MRTRAGRCLTEPSQDERAERAMRMMVRHDAYNRLLAAFSPGHIRLSIHTTANKDKYVYTPIGRCARSGRC